MDIFAEIRRILATILDLEEQVITPESYLLRELNTESVDLLEFAAALEGTFQIKINEGLLFLSGIRGGQPGGEAVPFLTRERLDEIATEPAGTPVLKVKDLVSYVAWQTRG